MGEDCERNGGNGGRDPQRRHWREPWETSGEDKTETETKIDVILYDDSERKWIDVEPGPFDEDCLKV